MTRPARCSSRGRASARRVDGPDVGRRRARRRAACRRAGCRRRATRPGRRALRVPRRAGARHRWRGRARRGPRPSGRRVAVDLEGDPAGVGGDRRALGVPVTVVSVRSARLALDQVGAATGRRRWRRTCSSSTKVTPQKLRSDGRDVSAVDDEGEVLEVAQVGAVESRISVAVEKPTGHVGVAGHERRRRHQRPVGGEPGAARDARQRRLLVLPGGVVELRPERRDHPAVGEQARGERPRLRPTRSQATSVNARGPPGSSRGTTATRPYWLSTRCAGTGCADPSRTAAAGVCAALGAALARRSWWRRDSRTRTRQTPADHHDDRDEGDQPGAAGSRGRHRVASRPPHLGDRRPRAQRTRSDGDQDASRPPGRGGTTARRTPPRRPSGPPRPRSARRRSRWSRTADGHQPARDGGDHAVRRGVEGAEQERACRSWRRPLRRGQRRRTRTAPTRATWPEHQDPGPADPVGECARSAPPAAGRRRWCRRRAAGTTAWRTRRWSSRVR